MARDPNKHQFNDKTGTGWKRDTNIESPTYGKWVQFKNWTKIKGSERDHLYIGAGIAKQISKSTKNLQKLMASQHASREEKLEQGWTVDSRGRWSPPPTQTDEAQVVVEDPNTYVPPTDVDLAAIQNYSQPIQNLPNTPYYEYNPAIATDILKQLGINQGTTEPAAVEPKPEPKKEPAFVGSHKNQDVAPLEGTGGGALRIQKKLMDAGFTQSELNKLQIKNRKRKAGHKY